MYSRWGLWEHVSPYPGSLGSLFSSQDSWEDLRHVSLGPPLFPGKGVISEACPGRDVLALPAPLLWGVSDLQHFGERPDSSELSFLLGGLGDLSPEGPLPLEPFLPWVGAASW